MSYFTQPPCEPSWALPSAIILLAVLVAALAMVILWPMRARAPVVDPHAEAFGDQPQVPS